MCSKIIHKKIFRKPRRGNTLFDGGQEVGLMLGSSSLIVLLWILGKGFKF